MLTFLIVLGLLFLLWVVIRALIPRGKIYIYVGVDEGKRPALVAYLKSDGTLIDLTQPRGQRRVGQVYLKEGEGIVRLYRRQDLAVDEEYEEVGHVDPEGKIFSTNGAQVSIISPDGKRRFLELFLRCHADVPHADPDAFGKCIETGRFRARQPNTATLLGRAGAALVLYCREAEGADETPRLAPHSIWDTALIASFMFTVIYFIPGVVQFFEQSYTVLPFLGREWSYVVSVTLLHLILWLALHVLKVERISRSNEVLADLMMINRGTGIQRCSWFGVLVGGVGIAWGCFVDAYIYIPLFISIFIGFLATALYATAGGWEVEPRQRSPIDEE